MLPAAHRLRRPQEFSATVRTGVRAGRSTLVVHLAPARGAGPAKVGFVVSKAVGNAVNRNLVKRRLRAASLRDLGMLPAGSSVVVRALPASAGATFDALADDLDGALRSALRKRAR
ncbi:ribonuclease P protein component [Luteimicrobium xylanilyticum]|uniref:ribonuclease P protein component n=1 Tax=Luteimicrobium xylanilyticum TaxID=1133546 RepID=UPI00129020BB|nr:ribonuclease P protein component [Luteimicrobium xylanilyticum]